ncbi:hypothetical protein EIP86_006574 [Pleurotus ostreatoroseus]|nr:hypothetical protein EIP86_006574 [Pleurotus ostreatoroseus]
MDPAGEYAESSRRAAMDAPFGPSDDYLNIRILNQLSKFVTESKAASKEEDDLRRADTDDIIIFRNIDRLFLDDTLLARMLDILILRPHPLHGLLRFVLAVVQSRLELCIPAALSEVSSYVFWPWTLARGVRRSLVDALAGSMHSHLLHSSSIDGRALSRRDSEWSISFAFIILLTNPNEITSAVPRLIRVSTQHAVETDFDWNPLDVFSYQMRNLVQCDDSWPERSLMLLARSLELLEAEEAAHCLAYVAYMSFTEPARLLERNSYQRLLERARLETLDDNDNDDDDDAMLLSPQRIVVLLEAARVILRKYIFEQSESRSESPSNIQDLLGFVLDAIPIVQHRLNVDLSILFTSTSDEPGLSRVLIDLFTTPHTIHSFLDFLIHHPRHLLIPTDPSYHDQSFPELVGAISRSRALCHHLGVLQILIMRGRGGEHPDFVQLCLVLLEAFGIARTIAVLRFVARVLSRL